ncbi:MAG TPA: hypothetical protein VKP30_24965, partial [Polyangiaceae bacterium]|nr:hypothetical protein [Polyangiaceae bacterium]
MLAFVRRAIARGKSPAQALIAIAGAAVLLGFSEPWYPIRHWLLWHYLALIGLTLFAGLAMLSLGGWILRRLFRLSLPTHERVALALALGLTGFELGMFLLGLVQAYGRVTFVLYPLFLSLLGIQQGRAVLRRFSRLSSVGPKLRPIQVVYVLFGLGALALIYFALLTPYNVQYDARWKHMALAEDFVAHGGVRRMPEGWVFSTRPHLTSYLYVWAFLLPFGTLFHRMELAAHLEFLVFSITTVFAIPALVRHLVPKADARVVWAARFLFPGVFLYDSSLSAGADHFGAVLTPALAIALLRAYRQLERKWVCLAVVYLAAAAMIKETVAIMLVPIPGLVLGLRGLSLLAKADPAGRRKLFATASTALVLGVTLTTPVWLRNLIWHGNPVYPNLGSLFPSRPWSSVAAYRFENEYSDVQMWAPPHDWHGVASTLHALYSFSFNPNDWSKFHGDRPVFGSIMTILIPVVLWLRRATRLWWFIGWIHGAIFIWYWVHHQDRYLQAILPLMAAVTASILILIFRQLRRMVKYSVASLVLIQLAATADVYFLPTHSMAGSPVRRVVENIGFGHIGKYDERFVIEPRWTAVGEVLPADAKLLFHDSQSNLGTAREGVRDAALWQYGLIYSEAKHPDEIHAWLTSMGVTHIVTSATKSTGGDRLAGDLMFFDFAYRRARFMKEVEGGLLLFENPPKPVDATFRNHVVVVSCDPTLELALHPLSNLAQPAFGPESQP